MPRAWIWLQLAIGWLPVGALYFTLILSAHSDVAPWEAGVAALRAIGYAALLGLAVHRLTARVRWPDPVTPRFLLIHLLAAAAYACVWVGLNTLTGGLLHGRIAALPSILPMPYLILGVWLYVMVAGTSYATRATARAARAEAVAAESRLAALRAQLNPHFLFNALHTVVHLIPRDPRRAAQAAEQIAGLLRTALEEERDLVPLAEEWAFVRRYLDIERLRFGERLAVDVDLSDETRRARVPPFALQTLVENAVRHGVSTREEGAAIRVVARRSHDLLTLSVEDDGPGGSAESGGGTGLQRLRGRLQALYDGRAALDTASHPGRGFAAVLRIPQ